MSGSASHPRPCLSLLPPPSSFPSTNIIFIISPYYLSFLLIPHLSVCLCLCSRSKCREFEGDGGTCARCQQPRVAHARAKPKAAPRPGPRPAGRPPAPPGSSSKRTPPPPPLSPDEDAQPPAEEDEGQHGGADSDNSPDQPLPPVPQEEEPPDQPDEPEQQQQQEEEEEALYESVTVTSPDLYETDDGGDDDDDALPAPPTLPTSEREASASPPPPVPPRPAPQSATRPSEQNYEVVDAPSERNYNATLTDPAPVPIDGNIYDGLYEDQVALRNKKDERSHARMRAPLVPPKEELTPLQQQLQLAGLDQSASHTDPEPAGDPAPGSNAELAPSEPRLSGIHR